MTVERVEAIIGRSVIQDWDGEATGLSVAEARLVLAVAVIEAARVSAGLVEEEQVPE